MYTLKDIWNGASIVVRSFLNRKREYRLQFNKENDGATPGADIGGIERYGVTGLLLAVMRTQGNNSNIDFSIVNLVDHTILFVDAA